MQDIDRLLEFLNTVGTASSPEIQAKLGLNQPKVSRLVKRAGNKILRIGQARSTQYALTRSVLGHYKNIPVYSIDHKGLAQHLFNLYGIGSGHCYIEHEGNTPWLNGVNGNGVFEDLPYFTDDLQPQGFLGRQAATYFAKSFGFPETLSNWNEKQIGSYLLQEGHNLPGNLILGEQSLSRFQNSDINTISNRQIDYPARAISILTEWLAGSSTGGEHQKFLAHTNDLGHVIVKFSPSGNSVEAQRWKDLLISEYHALDCMRAAGKAAAKTSFYHFENRIFLESQRFDRIGNKGRSAMISLASIDNEFIGSGGSWTQVAEKLYQQSLITEDDFHECIWNDLFGQWIGNSDRHLGNLSMQPTITGFKLLPTYDMLPMAYAPVRGEIIERTINTPTRPMSQLDELWHSSLNIACIFWQRIIEDKDISKIFRLIAKNNLSQIDKLV